MLALSLLAVSACSSYQGEKFGTVVETGGDGKPVTRHIAPSGVPFTLMRPQFLLTVTPATTADGKTVATLKTANVPDPDQTYSVRLRPGFLAAPDFKLSFAEGGAIDTTSATTTEQVTPAIKAIGAFAVDVIGATALGAHGAVKTRAGADQPTALRDSLIAALNSTDCQKKHWDYLANVPQPELVNPEWSRGMSVAQALTARLKAYNDDDAMMASFHYLTIGELKCLKSIAPPAGQAPATLQTFNQALTRYAVAYPADQLFPESLKAAVKAGKVDLTSNETKWPASGAQKDSQDDLIAKAKDVAKNALVSDFSDYLHGLTQVEPQVWRALHVKYLESEAQRAAALDLSVAGSRSAAHRALDRYQTFLAEQRAEAIGATEQYRRSLSLSRFLATVKSRFDRGGRAPAAAEYAQVRTELDNLNTAIEAKRATLLALLQPKAEPPPVAPLEQDTPTCALTRVQFDKATADAQLMASQCGVGTPPFVIVLEDR